MEFGYPKSIYDGQYVFPAILAVIGSGCFFYLVVDRGFAGWAPVGRSEIGDSLIRILMVGGFLCLVSASFYDFPMVAFFGLILAFVGWISNRLTGTIPKPKARLFLVASIILFLLYFTRPQVVA